MRLVEGARALAVVALMVGANAQADDPKYGKVETFEPGKKYTCVPTADHKGWNCNEIAPGGKQGNPTPSADTTPLPPPAAARAPEPIPASPATVPPAPGNARPKASGLPAYLRAGGSGGPVETAPVAASPTPAAPSSAATPVASPEQRPAPPAVSTPPAKIAEPAPAPSPADTKKPSTFSDVPPAATSAENPDAGPSSAPTPAPKTTAPPPAAVPAPQAAAPQSAAEVVSAPAAPAKSAASRQEPVPAQAPAAASQEPLARPQPAPVAPTSAPRPAHEPVAAPPAREAEQPAPPAAPAAPARATPEPAPVKPAPSDARGNREFLALPGSDYVIELAHSANVADLATLRGSLRLPRGQLYELHLRRDSGDWWLLVWGSFDSVDAARAARAELPADTAINAGWPRRIGALQSEARRVSSNQD